MAKICKNCNKYPVFGGGYCKNCQYLRKKKAPKKRSPINKLSVKQKERNKLYKSVRAEYLKNNPMCEVCGNIEADQIHHKKGRIGDLLFDTSFFMAVDFICHRKIHDNDAWARENGYMIKRN